MLCQNLQVVESTVGQRDETLMRQHRRRSIDVRTYNPDIKSKKLLDFKVSLPFKSTSAASLIGAFYRLYSFGN